MVDAAMKRFKDNFTSFTCHILAALATLSGTFT